jgi:hypothetical protein
MDAQTQVTGTTGAGPKVTQAAATVFALPLLPYAKNPLEPVISAKTVRLHYDRHNKEYVDTGCAIGRRARTNLPAPAAPDRC